MSITFNNGTHNIDVNTLDKLKDLTQDETNNLACGPQDAFFQKLDTINNCLEAAEIEPIDVTNSWNWKPGSFPKMKEYINWRLQLDKKCYSMDKLFTRTISSVNYTNYIHRQIKDMEFEKDTLKRLGVGRDVDIDKFKEDCIKFVENISEQCKKVSKLTQNKVSIDTYVENIEDRHPSLYYNVFLNGLTLSIYDGDNLIQDIPLETINLIFKFPLRHKLNKLSKDFTALGEYMPNEDKRFDYVYISSHGRRDSTYGTVCLDKHHDDIRKALYKNDLISFSFLLMQWAQYYNIKFSNPYNQPYMTHLGMPENFSDEYVSTQSKSGVIDRTRLILRRHARVMDLNYLEEAEYAVSALDKIECQFRNSSSYYSQMLNRINIIDTEYHYKVEALIFLILEHCMDSHNSGKSLNDISNEISTITGNGISYYNYMMDDGTCDMDKVWDNTIFVLYHWYITNGNVYDAEINCDYTNAWLESKGYIEKVKEEPAVIDEDNTADMKELMKQWAQSSERG